MSPTENPNKLPEPIREQLKRIKYYRNENSGDHNYILYQDAGSLKRDVVPIAIHALIQKDTNGKLFIDLAFNDEHDELDVAMLLDALTGQLLDDMEERYAVDCEEEDCDVPEELDEDLDEEYVEDEDEDEEYDEDEDDDFYDEISGELDRLEAKLDMFSEVIAGLRDRILTKIDEEYGE